MSDKTTILPSKVIQIGNDLALCEDGSIWAINDDRTTPFTWVCVCPPYQPPTQDAELTEALDVIESIMTNPDNDFQQTCWRRAWDILKKHGRIK